MSESVDMDGDLVEAAKENLGARNRAEAVEMALFLASVVENADELLEIHGYHEQEGAGTESGR